MTTPDRHNPYRILGIAGDRIGPFGLLGVSPERCERPEVARALRMQLARVDAHPDARTLEADELRRRLRHAANLLLDPHSLDVLRQQYHEARQEAIRQGRQRQTSLHRAHASGEPGTKRPAFPSVFPTASTPRPDSASAHDMQPAHYSTAPAHAAQPGMPSPVSSERPPTVPVNRSHRFESAAVRAQLRLTLMTSGGWNKRAMNQSLAVAVSHGLSSAQLAHELTTVASEMSSGQARFATATTGGAVDAQASAVAAGFVGAGPRDEEDDELAAEIAARRNLAVAAVTFVLGLLLTIPFGLWVMSEIRGVSQANRQARTGGQSAPQVTGETGSAGAGSPGTNAIDSGDASPGTRHTPADDAGSAVMATRPLPLTMSQALDRLDDEFRSTTGMPTRMLDQFDGIITQARASWTQYDGSSRTRVLRFVLDVMCDKGTDGNVAGWLLARIAPAPGPAWTPDGIPSYVWSTGALGMLIGDEALPEQARAQALRLWEQFTRGVERTVPSEQLHGFSEAAGQALHLVASDLMSQLQANAVDDERLALWDSWIRTVEALHQQKQASTRPLMETAYALLCDGPELATNETARRVLIALLAEVDLTGTPSARAEIVRWFSEPRVSPGDLNVVTSYLVSSQRVPGLDSSYIVNKNANSSQRAQLREQLQIAWPASGDPESNVGAAMADWMARTDRLLLRSGSGRTSDEQLTEVLQFAHVNEAAAWLELGQTSLATEVLNNSRRVIATAGTEDLTRRHARVRSNSSGTGAGGRPDISFGADGEWTVLVEQALRRNDRQRTIDLIQWLGVEAVDGGSGHADLGPIDAAKLVDLAIYGLNRVIRGEAMSVIETKFPDGYNVVLALADAIPRDRKDSALSRTVEEIIEGTLPAPGSANWYTRCRLGLLQHALALRGPTVEAARIDGLAALLGRPYRAQASAASEWTSIGYADPALLTRLALRASTSSSDEPASGVADPASARRQQVAPEKTETSSNGPGRAPFPLSTRAEPNPAGNTSDSPAVWLSVCHDAWMSRARHLAPMKPVPTGLETMQARHDARVQLAGDPISLFAAQQYGLLEVMVYVTAAERPAVSESLMEILTRTLHLRAQAETVLRQLLIVEQAMTEVWKIRLLQSSVRGGGGRHA